MRIDRCGGLLVVMALALAGAGCRSLQLKEPFPCSADRHCPAPYQCGSDNMCRTNPAMGDASPDGVDGNDADRPDSNQDGSDSSDGPGDAEAGNDGPAIATGQPCSLAADCASKACVDGVCCESSCAAACKACAMKYTGQADGTCAATTAGNDPHDDCSATTPEQCGDDGMCDGAGACRKFGTTQVCAAAMCAGSQFHPTQTCTGTGSCATKAPVDCGAFACMATGCAMPCTGDGDCPSGNYCLSGMCKAKKADGSTCTMMNECTNGHCVDGFCCDGLCDATCNACSNAKTGQANGHCAPIPAGQDPDNDCAPGPVCGLDGTCNGSNGCRITPMNTACGSASCTGTNTYTPRGACDGVSTCTPGSQQACPGSFTCASSTACRTACTPATSATDCAPGNYCSGSTCMPAKGPGVSCSANIECASGSCVDGVCCSSACGLAATGPGMCMGCAATTTGMPNGTCAPRTASTTSACPAVNPNTCVNLRTDPLNCNQCGNVCPTTGAPSGGARACLFGACGFSCTTPGSQLCTLDMDGAKSCVPTSWGFEAGEAGFWTNSADNAVMPSTDQHHSGSGSLASTPPDYSTVPATVLSIPCISATDVGSMDLRGKTFSAFVFVPNSTSSYAGTKCLLRAVNENFMSSQLIGASVKKEPIVPGSWFQLSATFPTTSLESVIYEIAIDCYLPSDWALDDPTKLWFVDDVQVK